MHEILNKNNDIYLKVKLVIRNQRKLNCWSIPKMAEALDMPESTLRNFFYRPHTKNNLERIFNILERLNFDIYDALDKQLKNYLVEQHWKLKEMFSEVNNSKVCR